MNDLTKYLRLFYLSIFFLPFLLYSQNYSRTIDSLENIVQGLDQKKSGVLVEIEKLKLKKVSNQIQKIAIPKTNSNEQVIHHSAMSLSYNEKHEQANWVAHMIIKDIKDGNVTRTNDFRVDPFIKTGTAVKDDYWYSGYDRGHLAPSADFRWSRKALSESYYYSNMSPQLPDLNRQIWAKLENKLREWAIENEEIYVVTGGVLKPGLKTIGENKVSVPNFYYKIIVDYLEPEFKALAFVMPNGSTKKHFLEYAVSIDSVERLTGIDFFPNIPDVIEDRIEESINVSLWTKEKAESDGVPPLPFKKGRFNTLQAKYHIGQECKVCGTVVSTKYNKKGKGSPTYINLDKQFPNHVFSITIWGDDRKNFSFDPEMELMNKAICVTGIIKTFKGVPQLTLNSESQMEFLDEYSGGFKN